MDVKTNITTLGDYLAWAENYFAEYELYYGHGTDNPWDEAVMLALYVLQLPAENDRSILELVLSSEQREQLISLAQRRVQEKIPVPYLTNEAWFAGEKYYVTQDVIIPRSPFAELIANHFQPWLGNIEPQNILDMCTGSACLAIYTAKEFPEAQVDAVDISLAALAIATKNIAMHDCIDRVHPIHSDLFSAFSDRKYDIIISNPPYVSAQDMADLPAEFRHEPELALASGADGLDLTIELLRQAPKFLQPHGLLIVEVGNSWYTLSERYPQIPFTWLEFANGGEGVFLLTAAELKELKL